MARTDGTSAEFTIKWSLDTTTTVVDQPVHVRSANFSADFVPSRSTQLSTMRSPWTVICGTELFAPAGELSDSTLSAAGACAWPTAHEIARTPNAPIHCLLLMPLVSAVTTTSASARPARRYRAASPLQ